MGYEYVAAFDCMTTGMLSVWDIKAVANTKPILASLQLCVAVTGFYIAGNMII